MKRYWVLLFLCFYTFSYAQKLQLKKASPFTAVKWKADVPIVKFNNNWYKLEKLGKYKTHQIIAFCKKNYNTKWQKRFSEDLVEVLKNMGTIPTVNVELLLSNKKHSNISFLGVYTYENRQKVVRFNRKNSTKLKQITALQAIEDINEFQKTLEERSSYIHLSNFDYKKAISLLKLRIINKKTDIKIDFLTNELAKIMAEIGDRHSYVKNERLDIKEAPNYKLQLPFSIAPLNGKVVALKRKKKDAYKYLHKKYPFVKSINNFLIDEIIDSLVYKSKKAPKDAKFSLGIAQIQKLGKLYFKNNLTLPKQIKVVFTNWKKDTVIFVKLKDKNYNYFSTLEKKTKLNSKEIKKGKFKNLSNILNENIGYIKIPEMFSLHRIKGLKKSLDSTFLSLKKTKALIIDLRYNPGGTRDLIQLISEYIVPKSVSPWVANIAYLRSDTIKKLDKSSMNGRYLHSYHSEQFTNLDRKAIDIFNKNFQIKRDFEKSKFSNPFYMVLHSGKISYKKPVYILVNEHSFSAATVFTSAFKGLPSVKIVGVTTDGSSGNSKKFYLKHSNIKVKFSTMLSFQRNGKTLDGNGTKPEIEIKRNEKQVLNGEDSQLNTLIRVISLL